MALRPKIVKLAKVIGGVPGKLTKIDENAPEYYCLECVVTDEQADVAIAARFLMKDADIWNTICASI